MDPSFETNGNIYVNATYFNSYDEMLLHSSKLVDEYRIDTYFETDYITEDIVDGYDGITQTTYSGYVLYPSDSGGNWYKVSPAPKLIIEYTETLAGSTVPEPCSLILLGCRLLGLIKKLKK